ncbi:MAG TPA: proline--tRNA ligase [bacterium]|nr:proline--tRNA ligase [bacterium]
MYRLSHYLLPTTKEDPSGAEIPSHRLMIRAGMVRQLMAGVYSHLPLMWRAIRKAEQIVREEQDRIGAQELFMPGLNPAELWQETGRWSSFGDEMFRLKDRKGTDLALAPTHEEVITDLARTFIQSYKELPQQWYQFQTKFRDEPRPRSGVLRGRQFIMKDAYSLDVDQAGLDAAYALQREAYQRTFRRCGISFVIVGASSGLMGGSGSEEFMVMTPSGEDTIAVCTNCGYAANVEVAEGTLPRDESTQFDTSGLADTPQPVPTPGMKTIEEVSGFLNVDPRQTLKTMLYMTAEEPVRPVMAVVRGDHDVNVERLGKVVGAGLRPAHEAEVEQICGGPAGYISPVGVGVPVDLIVDAEVDAHGGYVAGANQADTHFTSVSPLRDFPEGFRHVRIRMVTTGDLCVRCGGPLTVSRAIELGHIFKLGTKYSTALGATYLDSQGQQQPIVMGSYGIGLERIVACAIEQHHDEHGIIFPVSIAPFHVEVLMLDPADAEVRATAEGLAAALEEEGWDVLLDDRAERPGVKFADADLIGLPLQVIVGRKGLAAGQIEVKQRRTGERFHFVREDAPADIIRLLETDMAALSPESEQADFSPV